MNHWDECHIMYAWNIWISLSLETVWWLVTMWWIERKHSSDVCIRYLFFFFWNWTWCYMTNAMLARKRTERKFLFYLALNKLTKRESRMLMTCSQIHADTHQHTHRDMHRHMCVCRLFVYSLCFAESCGNTKQFMFILFWLFSGIILKLIP